MAIKKTTVAPSAAGSSSIATKPAKQIPNTDKREMDKATGNTKLKMTTCYGGNDGSPNYDDAKETGVSYSHPDAFQTTIDKSDRIPAWNSMSVSQDSPDAITRTNEPIYHQGFRKEPNKTVMDHADNKVIRTSRKQDGGDIIHNQNSQVDKALIPTSTAIYGGKLPKRSSSSSAVS
jgi:hypothetical protein